MNLDASNSGQLAINNSQFTLANVSYSQSEPSSFSPLLDQFSLVNVGIAINTGPINVTNGNFTITRRQSVRCR